MARAQSPAGEPEHIQAEIAAALAPFRSRRVPLSWWTGPSTRPTDLGSHLRACGLRRAFDAPGLAADLGALPEPAARVQGLTVRRSFAEQFAEVSGITSEVLASTVAVVGDLAWAAYDLRYTETGGAAPTGFESRWTCVLRRDPDGWKFVHMQHSRGR